MNEKKLKARDFITIGIFTAILWVVQMVIMYLGISVPVYRRRLYGSHPDCHWYSDDALLCADREVWDAYNNIGYCCNPSCLIFGMGFLGAPICIAAGVIADLIAKSGKYKSWKKPLSAAAYLIFGLAQVISLSSSRQTLISKV